MNHPLIDQLDELSITEVENKIVELQRKYFQTRNPQLRIQIASVLDIYREEARCRRAKEFAKQQNNNDSDLDSLINIS